MAPTDPPQLAAAIGGRVVRLEFDAAARAVELSVALPDSAPWRELSFQALDVRAFTFEVERPDENRVTRTTVTRAETVRIRGGLRTVVGLEPGGVTITVESQNVSLGLESE